MPAARLLLCAQLMIVKGRRPKHSSGHRRQNRAVLEAHGLKPTAIRPRAIYFPLFIYFSILDTTALAQGLLFLAFCKLGAFALDCYLQWAIVFHCCFQCDRASPRQAR
jgi:hypothetical protein